MSSPYGPMVLICNRRAGRRRRTAQAIEAVSRHLARRELEHEIRMTAGPGDATLIARRALEEGTSFIVALGGDGTVHEVVNGMMRDDRAVNADAVLGVVAAGRGCDFIRTFGIPPLPSHAAAHLDGPEAFPIDIGKVTCMSGSQQIVRYFSNVAEAGLGAEVAERASRLPAALGSVAYVLAFWFTILRYRPAGVVVDLVDRSYEGPMNNLVVANGQFFGGGMKVAPKAAPTDGLLDVQIEHARRLEEIAVMPRVYRGEHVPHPDIVEAKRVRVGITAGRPLKIEADGEVLGHTPATFEVLRGALRLKV